MKPQGNILRNESLVLFVYVEKDVDAEDERGGTPTPLSPSEASSFMEESINRASGQIFRHIEMRFNKPRFARQGYDLLSTAASAEPARETSEALASYWIENVKFQSFPMDEVGTDNWKQFAIAWKGRLEASATVLILFRYMPVRQCDDSRQGRDRSRDMEEMLIRQLQPPSRPCAFEFFHVALKPKPQTPSYNNKLTSNGYVVPDDVPAEESALYHLASRVCGAMTEYICAYDCKSTPCTLEKLTCGKTNVDYSADCPLSSQEAETLTCREHHPLSPLDLANADQRRRASDQPWGFVPKILDVNDAISLVCEGLDGSEHFFPPIPRGLQRIFAGTANDDRSVAVRYKFPFGVWFRGQSRVCLDVVPSLFHESHWQPIHNKCHKLSPEKTMYDEATLVHHFMSHKPLLRHDYIDHFEWLCLMQHHGAPTRVLDWTENILIALYFAVCDTTADCDGVIWALNAGRLNEITRVSSSRRYVCLSSSTDVILRSAMAVSRTGGELRRTLKKIGKLSEVEDTVKDRVFWKWTESDVPGAYESTIVDPRGSLTWHKLAAPVAVFPTRVNAREEDQLATFTLYGGKQYDSKVTSIGLQEEFSEPLGLIELSRLRQNGNDEWDETRKLWKPSGKPFLDAFVIPSCAKRKLREQLKRLGIHVGSLFPELEHQAKYIRHQWRFEYKGEASSSSTSKK